MHLHLNHSFVTRSNWDGEWYGARHMITIEKRDIINEREPDSDFANITNPSEFLVKDRMESFKRELTHNKKIPIEQHEKMIRVFATEPSVDLKPEVLDWLDDNVPDINPVTEDVYHDDTMKAWAMGNDEYRVASSYNSITLWFQRYEDACAFIARWSVHKLPTTKHDYFEGVRWQLKNGELVVVDDFT